MIATEEGWTLVEAEVAADSGELLQFTLVTNENLLGAFYVDTLALREV